MYQYFFVLGNNHSLSKIEILSLLDKLHIKMRLISSSGEVLVIESDSEISAPEILKTLGGTIKAGKIIETVPINKFLETYETKLTDIKILSKLFDPELNKLTFGISVYNSDSTISNINKIFPLVIKLLPRLKSFLETSYKTSFFRSHERVISSVSVIKNHLITKGFELVICVTEDSVYLGKTLAVQDFEDYSFRDYKRPGRDQKAGMIPPKLAKIMINISGVDYNKTILDPFCGNGTILQELILLGYKNIIGADYQAEQINKTKQNISWLFEQYRDLIKSDFSIKTFQSDVRKLSTFLPSKSIDAIITEPFLGSPKSKSFNITQIENEIAILEKLYLDAFYQFKTLLSTNGKIVVIFPVYKLGNNFHFLNILPQISKLGFSLVDFRQNPVFNNLQLEVTERGSIIYSRPNQTISREIFIFQWT